MPPNDTGRREKPLGEPAWGLQHHREQDLELVLAEPEAAIVEIKNPTSKALIQRLRKARAITPLLCNVSRRVHGESQRLAATGSR